jgi:hypothetical protein
MRIPIVMGGCPADDDAVLVEAGQTMPAAGYAVEFAAGKAGHPLSCACCTQRGPVADALGRMFRARATGAAPFFKRVVVLASAAGQASVHAALMDDVVTGARYQA